MTVKWHKIDQELQDFLLQVEDAIIGFQRAADTYLDDVDAVEGISVQAELLLRDVLIEGIRQPLEGEVIVAAIVNVVRDSGTTTNSS